MDLLYDYLLLPIQIIALYSINHFPLSINDFNFIEPIHYSPLCCHINPKQIAKQTKSHSTRFCPSNAFQRTSVSKRPPKNRPEKRPSARSSQFGTDAVCIKDIERTRENAREPSRSKQIGSDTARSVCLCASGNSWRLLNAWRGTQAVGNNNSGRL